MFAVISLFAGYALTYSLFISFLDSHRQQPDTKR
jgi:hypothetical protein